jgi:Fe-Mn family superoxide dismutase
MMTRRQAIKSTALASAALAVLPGALAQPTPAAAPAAAAPTGPFTLPPLPYAYDALEPHIDAQTMQIHHDKHHAAYVANLNKAVGGSIQDAELSYESVAGLLKNLNSVPENVRTAVRNNGGGHYNHSLFWEMMKKGGGGEPKAELAKAIETSFGNFANFQTQFSEAATKIFGSGWVWLTTDGPNSVVLGWQRLKIESYPNQDSPLSSGRKPILGLDVWEHAYYLKYQNKRADYITAWWNVVNWDFVSELYAKSKTSTPDTYSSPLRREF